MGAVGPLPSASCQPSRRTRRNLRRFLRRRPRCTNGDLGPPSEEESGKQAKSGGTPVLLHSRGAVSPRLQAIRPVPRTAQEEWEGPIPKPERARGAGAPRKPEPQAEPSRSPAHRAAERGPANESRYFAHRKVGARRTRSTAPGSAASTGQSGRNAAGRRRGERSERSTPRVPISRSPRDGTGSRDPGQRRERNLDHLPGIARDREFLLRHFVGLGTLQSPGPRAPGSSLAGLTNNDTMQNKNTTVVVTCADDPTSDLVERELDAMGASWVRFNTEELPQRVQLDIELGPEGLRGAIAFPDRTLDLDDISAIWWRRPEPPRISERVTDSEARDVAEAESRSALRGLWAGLYDRYWMSYPANIRRANEKILQLRLAASLGFEVPRTVITQSSEVARKFVNDQPCGVALKTLSGIFIEGPPHRAIYTNHIDADDDLPLEDVGLCPSQFQAYVPKAAELRVTVVGTSVFAVEMATQKQELTSIDWRRGTPVDVPHTAVELIPTIELRCLALVRRLGLTFGAIDMIRTPSGEYVFLEVNPAGQWAWLEGLTGLPIARTIAETLHRGDVNDGPRL